ncbi:hypothetical protein YC2023_080691 [Brassica napus]
MRKRVRVVLKEMMTINASKEELRSREQIKLKNLKHDKNEDVAKGQAVKNQKCPVVFKPTSRVPPLKYQSVTLPTTLIASSSILIYLLHPSVAWMHIYTNQARDEPKSYPFPNSGNRGHTQIIPSTNCFKEMVDQIPAILKVRNVKKRLDLIHIVSLLRQPLIQASINIHMLNKFKHLLEKGSFKSSVFLMLQEGTQLQLGISKLFPTRRHTKYTTHHGNPQN